MYVPVTVKLPAATPIIVTVQLLPDKVQLGSTAPIPRSDEEKLTVPVGIFNGFVESATETAQELTVPAFSEAGQDNVTEVSSLAGLVTLIVAEVPEPPL